MPIDKYKCFNCEKVFIVALSPVEKQRGAIVLCPGCGSKDVRPLAGRPAAKTADRTASK